MLSLREDQVAAIWSWPRICGGRPSSRPLTGTYRTACGHNIPRGYSVSRADLAHRMLRPLEHPEAVKQTVGIAS